MAHIHKLIDFIVEAYIVYDNKVLLVDHKKAQTWLPVGGHVELHEDPEEAILREAKEEAGLTITLLGERLSGSTERFKFLVTPKFLNIHETSLGKSHRHIGIVYFAKSETEKVTLSEGEHTAIRWFSEKELDMKEYAVIPQVKQYAMRALTSCRSV